MDSGRATYLLQGAEYIEGEGGVESSGGGVGLSLWRTRCLGPLGISEVPGLGALPAAAPAGGAMGPLLERGEKLAKEATAAGQSEAA